MVTFSPFSRFCDTDSVSSVLEELLKESSKQQTLLKKEIEKRALFILELANLEKPPKKITSKISTRALPLSCPPNNWIL